MAPLPVPEQAVEPAIRMQKGSTYFHDGDWQVCFTPIPMEKRKAPNLRYRAVVSYDSLAICGDIYTERLPSKRYAQELYERFKGNKDQAQCSTNNRNPFCGHAPSWTESNALRGH